MYTCQSQPYSSHWTRLLLAHWRPFKTSPEDLHGWEWVVAELWMCIFFFSKERRTLDRLENTSQLECCGMSSCATFTVVACKLCIFYYRATVKAGVREKSRWVIPSCLFFSFLFHLAPVLCFCCLVYLSTLPLVWSVEHVILASSCSVLTAAIAVGAHLMKISKRSSLKLLVWERSKVLRSLLRQVQAKGLARTAVPPFIEEGCSNARSGASAEIATAVSEEEFNHCQWCNGSGQYWEAAVEQLGICVRAVEIFCVLQGYLMPVKILYGSCLLNHLLTKYCAAPPFKRLGKIRQSWVEHLYSITGENGIEFIW